MQYFLINLNKILIKLDKHLPIFIKLLSISSKTLIYFFIILLKSKELLSFF